MEVKVDTSQIKQLEDFFNELSKEDQKKVWMTAYRKAAKPLVMRASEYSPEGVSHTVKGKPHAGGTLKRSWGTIENPDNLSILIGSLYGKKAYYVNFLEGGTKERKTKTRGWSSQWIGHRGIKEFTAKRISTWQDRKLAENLNRGRIEPRAFFERAWHDSEEQMYGAIHQEWENALQKRIDVLNARKKLYGK